MMTVLGVAEQCLHQVMDSSASLTALPVKRLGEHKKLRGDRTRTAGPNWPKGYSIPYSIMVNNKIGGGGGGWGRGPTAQVLAVGGEQLHYASCVFCIPLSSQLSFSLPFLSY